MNSKKKLSIFKLNDSIPTRISKFTQLNLSAVIGSHHPDTLLSLANQPDSLWQLQSWRRLLLDNRRDLAVMGNRTSGCLATELLSKLFVDVLSGCSCDIFFFLKIFLLFNGNISSDAFKLELLNFILDVFFLLNYVF